MTTVEQSHAYVAPRRKSRRQRGWLLLLPLLVVFAILFYFPVLNLLSLSVLDPKGDLSFANYARLGASPVYANSLSVTLQVAGWTSLLTIVMGYPVAYLIATTRGGLRSLLLICILMPYWTGYLVRAFSWIVLLGQNGVLNRLLQALGVEAPPRLIYNWTGVMIGTVNSLMPLAIMTMVAVMQSIDMRLPSAARTLGAGGGQTFWRIYFPLSLPGVAAAALLVFMSALGFFVTPALLGGGRMLMIAQLIITEVQELLNWGFAGAISVLLIATAFLVFVLYNKLFGLGTLSRSERPSNRGFVGTSGARLGAAILGLAGSLCDLVGKLQESLHKPQYGRPSRNWSSAIIWAAGIAAVLFLIAPSLFIIPVSFTEGSFIEWPPRGFSMRWYDAVLSSPRWPSAALHSAIIAAFSALLALVIGTPAAYALAQARVWGKTFWMGLILLPIVMPSILFAVALFYVYSRIGLVGSYLGLVMGHVVLTAPFVVIVMTAVFRTYDVRLDQAALTMGASRWSTIRRVTLPLIRNGLISAFLVAFITSFEELTVAMFVTGGLVTTLPREMWSDALLAVSPALAVVATIISLFVALVICLVTLSAKARSNT